MAFGDKDKKKSLDWMWSKRKLPDPTRIKLELVLLHLDPHIFQTLR